MSHPSGVGLWGMKRRGVVEGYIKIAPGHTAMDAFVASGLRADYGFNELTFELVADVAPAVEPAPYLPEQPRRRRATRKPVGRLVGAERARL